jgi:hypothetical protein
MQNLLSEFEEKVSEIVVDAIYQVIEYVCEQSLVSQNSSYLQSANHTLKKILKVFNYSDSCGFIRSYQRYLVPYLIHRATKLDGKNHKIITKSIEFLSRKLNCNIAKLIEDNFPFIFSFTTLNSNGIGNIILYYMYDLKC